MVTSSIGATFIGVVLLAIVVGALYLLVLSVRALVSRHYLKGAVLLLVVPSLYLLSLTPLTCQRHAVERARRAACANQVRNFVLLMKMYAGDHEGHYPSDLKGLLGAYLQTNDVHILTCPSVRWRANSHGGVGESIDYGLVSGLTEKDPPGCIIMFCPPANHQGEGAVVGRLDGRDQWMSAKSFQELTNTPSLFYGTTNQEQLAELKQQTRIILPASCQ